MASTIISRGSGSDRVNKIAYKTITGANDAFLKWKKLDMFKSWQSLNVQKKQYYLLFNYNLFYLFLNKENVNANL